VAGDLVARTVRAMEVVAWTVAMLVVLIGAGLEGLARGPRASVVRLAVRARALALLRAGVLRVGALTLAGSSVVAPLLAVVRLTMGRVVSGGAASAAAGWRPAGAAVAVGVGRLHWRRV
jgi:hypothetical protein